MAEPSKPTETIEVFFSYSHKDEDYRVELSNHLAMLQRQHLIGAWHDRRIGAGKEWEKEINEHLYRADIILLLVSSDFLASDYCYDVEVKTAMERNDNGEARVIPIILRPVDWKGALFGKLQALPKDARPVTDWTNRDEAFLDVARGIRVAAEELAVNQFSRLFASLAKVESLKNWPNVISIGERILKSLPAHLPEYQAVRSKTAAAYVRRWSSCFNESGWDPFGSGVSIKTKRHEDPAEIRPKIIADLNRAIELEPDNAEYYYLRFSMRGKESDIERAIELDPSTVQYYLARAWNRECDDDKEGAARDRQRAMDLGYMPPTKYFLRRLNLDENLFDERKAKEVWRLKCLRD